LYQSEGVVGCADAGLELELAVDPPPPPLLPPLELVPAANAAAAAKRETRISKLRFISIELLCL
jgi:hypothetical protein